MKKYLLIIITVFCSMALYAQDRPKFDPVKFEADLEQFVIKEANITPAEQKEFLPIFREMRKKQVSLMEASRKNFGKKPSTEQEWEQSIKNHDAMEIEMKKIAQNFHLKAIKVIPASKVMKVIKAEECFHRQQFKQFAGKGPARRPRNQ